MHKPRTTGTITPSTLLRVRIETMIDRKSTRLNSSHMSISYAVFCLKKKKLQDTDHRLELPRGDANDCGGASPRTDPRSHVKKGVCIQFEERSLRYLQQKWHSAPHTP